MKTTHEVTIKVWYSETNEGYMYDIFDTVDIDDDTEAVDGGVCTGTFSDALQMAVDNVI